MVQNGKYGIFLAQFMGKPGFGNLMEAAQSVKNMGYTHVQLPDNVFNLRAAAKSKTYAENKVTGPLGQMGVETSEISIHIPGQTIAVHPAYMHQFAGFAGMKRPNMRRLHDWGANRIRLAIDAAVNMGLKTLVGFTGSFLWPYIYEWPQRPKGMVREAFDELAKRWLPLIRYAASKGIRIAFELHPGEDVHDGRTFRMFLEALERAGATNDELNAVGINFDPSHPILYGQSNEQLVKFLRIWQDRIFAYHVKDAEINIDEESGFFGGFAPWDERVGKFRTPGRGQVDFEMLAGFIPEDLIWVLEWEDANQAAEQGAVWGRHYMEYGVLPTEALQAPAAGTSFDDAFQGSAEINKMLGWYAFRA